jgi:hypothetical protein
VGISFGKLTSGVITLTHFSDILRFSLLYKYGGFWMDSTILMLGKFDSCFFDYPYFTLKGAFKIWNWTNFFQGATAGCLLMKMERDFFFEYWKKENILVTYLLIDCITQILYQDNAYVKSLIDILPPSDSSVFILNDKLLNTEFSQKGLENLKKRTVLNKLSYKKQGILEKNQKQTYYSFIISHYK